MLFLCCNSVEVVRLRSILLQAMEQIQILEEVYTSQAKMMSREAKLYFKNQFNLSTYVNAGENFVDFIEEGPGNMMEMKLTINEFDQKLRSSVNFTDPDCFKSLILPLGLEELRVVVQYEVMNLQCLIVAVRTN